jgi:predicted dinucleotide-binding enzyme
MNIVCIGAGNVGAALAIRLANAGHRVVLARTREGGSSVDAAYPVMAWAPPCSSAAMMRPPEPRWRG